MKTKYFFAVMLLAVLAVVTVSPVAGSQLVRQSEVAEPSASNYYVATNGSDSNPGSLAAPFATLQRAIEVVQPGDTIYVRGGTYREANKNDPKGGIYDIDKSGLPGRYIKIFAYPGETPVFKGSDVVTGWVHHQGNIWKKTWRINSQQVFVDGAPLQQMGLPSNTWTGDKDGDGDVDEEAKYLQNKYLPVERLADDVADMYRGTFFYDAPYRCKHPDKSYNCDVPATLYVWLRDSSDPNAHVIEASTRVQILFFGLETRYWHVRGLSFQHSNTIAGTLQGWPAVFIPNDSIVENSRVEWADCGGLTVGDRTVAQNNVVSHNGCSGVGIGGRVEINGEEVILGVDAQIKDNIVTHNNYRRFVLAPNGIMSQPGVRSKVENNVVASNLGMGIWYEGCGSNGEAIVSNNYVYDNAWQHLEGYPDPWGQPIPRGAWLGSGIFIQHCQGLDIRVYNNLLVGNKGLGIDIVNSEKTKVFHNTVIGSGYAGIRGNWQPDDFQLFPFRDNRINGNLVYHDRFFYQPPDAIGGYFDLSLEEGKQLPPGVPPELVTNNSSDYNLFFRRDSQLHLSSARIQLYTTLGAWQIATGWDANSVSADPMFVGTGPQPYQLTAASSAIDAGGTDCPPTDYLGNPRTDGDGDGIIECDIGAFEYQPYYNGGENKLTLEDWFFRAQTPGVSGSIADDILAITVNNGPARACWHQDLDGAALQGKAIRYEAEMHKTAPMNSAGGFANPYISLQIQRGDGSWQYNYGGIGSSTATPGGPWVGRRIDVTLPADMAKLRASFCVYDATVGTAEARALMLRLAVAPPPPPPPPLGQNLLSEHWTWVPGTVAITGVKEATALAINVTAAKANGCWVQDMSGAALRGATVRYEASMAKTGVLNRTAPKLFVNPYISLQAQTSDGIWHYNHGGVINSRSASGGPYVTESRDIVLPANLMTLRASFCVWQAQPGTGRGKDFFLRTVNPLLAQGEESMYPTWEEYMPDTPSAMEEDRTGMEMPEMPDLGGLLYLPLLQQ